MDDQQIQDIAERAIEALGGLAPGEPSAWAALAALTPPAALIAAIVAGVAGRRDLKQQQKTLQSTEESNARNLDQKREAYGTGTLDLLAQSELAGPRDKELLDALWEGSSTKMHDEDIEVLIAEAREQEARG